MPSAQRCGECIIETAPSGAEGDASCTLQTRSVTIPCNTAAVDLESIAGDAHFLRSIIERHFELTRSPRAKWILENWSTMQPKFVKVFPHEYKRVLKLTHQPLAASHQLLVPQVAHG